MSSLSRIWRDHAAARPAFSWDQTQDVREDLAYWRKRGQEIGRMLSSYDERTGNYKEYCESHGIHPDRPSLEMAELMRGKTGAMLDEFERRLDQKGGAHGDKIHDLKRLYRAMLFSKITLFRALSYNSPAADQSTDAYFGDIADQSEIVWQSNPAYQLAQYDRNESRHVEDLERNFLGVLNYDPARQDLMLTSSGMAAMGLIEHYLFSSGRVGPGDGVVIPGTTYCETFRRTFDHGGVVKHVLPDGGSDWEAALVAAVATHRPRAILLEPISNQYGQRLCDVAEVIDGINRLDLDAPVAVILDDSLCPGAVNPFPLTREGKTEAFVVTSGSKYLHLGQDIASFGTVVCDRGHMAGHDHKEGLKAIRQERDMMLYDIVSWSVPEYDRADYLYRLNRITRNGLLLGAILNGDAGTGAAMHARFPLLPDHPDRAAANQLPFTGGIVAVHMPDLPDPDTNLKELIPFLLANAKARGINLVKGQGFGYVQPRIWLNRDNPDETGTRKTYLRLYAGDQTLRETEDLSRCIRESISTFVARRNLAPVPGPAQAPA